ncbi:MAG: hypothetical protein ACOYBM_06660 [Dethiobacteria bacterium]|jgi:uncharacterized membrane protein
MVNRPDNNKKYQIIGALLALLTVLITFFNNVSLLYLLFGLLGIFFGSRVKKKINKEMGERIINANCIALVVGAIIRLADFITFFN